MVIWCYLFLLCSYVDGPWFNHALRKLFVSISFSSGKLEIHGYIWWRAKALWSKDFCQNGLRCWNLITQELHRFGQCTLWILISHVWIMLVFGLWFVEFKWINDDEWVVQYRHSTCYFGTFTYFKSFLVYYTVKLALLEPNYKTKKRNNLYIPRLGRSPCILLWLLVNCFKHIGLNVKPGKPRTAPFCLVIRFNVENTIP